MGEHGGQYRVRNVKAFRDTSEYNAAGERRGASPPAYPFSGYLHGIG
jgi:hypothetical protein